MFKGAAGRVRGSSTVSERVFVNVQAETQQQQHGINTEGVEMIAITVDLQRSLHHYTKSN